MGNSLNAGNYFLCYRAIASLLIHLYNLYLFSICHTCTLEPPHCLRSTLYQNREHCCLTVGPGLSKNQICKQNYSHCPRIGGCTSISDCPEALAEEPLALKLYYVHIKSSSALLIFLGEIGHVYLST